MPRARFVSFGISAAFLITGAVGFSCSSSDDSAAPDQSDASIDVNIDDAPVSRDSSAPSDANEIDAAAPPAKLFGGGFNSCLLEGGVLKCWGADGFGNLGTGTFMTRQPTPTAVPGISPSIVAVGGHHLCAANATTTWCWGWDGTAALGHDPLLDPDSGADCEGTHCATSPVVVPGLSGVKALAAADFTSCAINSDKTVSCWGEDDNAFLGFPAPDSGEVSVGGFPIVIPPTNVPGVSGAKQLAVGLDDFQCILQSSPGPVTCWGADYLGYLGGNPTDAAPNVALPATVPGITNATSIVVGEDHLCAILADKTVSCWGSNELGQLGHDPASDPHCGTTPCDPTPTTVAGLSDVVALSAGADFTCALKSNSTVVCWGDDQYGQLDVDPALDDAGNETSFQFTPAPISGLPPVAQIAVGWYHGCVLTTAGDVYCWGNNQDEQLGAAVTTFAPVKINGL